MIATIAIAQPVPITHTRYVSVCSPQFHNCFELGRSGEIRRFLAGQGATITYTGTASIRSTIAVPPGAIVLMRRIQDRKSVTFELDVPVPAPHFYLEYADDLPDPPPSALPARSTPARKGIS